MYVYRLRMMTYSTLCKIVNLVYITDMCIFICIIYNNWILIYIYIIERDVHTYMITSMCIYIYYNNIT